MNYTTIEQSKHLLEIGLDPNTADMSWEQTTNDLRDDYAWMPYLGPNPAIRMNTFSFRNGYVLPCWSVSALLDLMPEYINRDHAYVMYLYHVGDEYGMAYEEDNRIEPPLVTVNGQDCITCVVRMAEWLIKNKELNKYLIKR